MYQTQSVCFIIVCPLDAPFDIKAPGERQGVGKHAKVEKGCFIGLWSLHDRGDDSVQVHLTVACLSKRIAQPFKTFVQTISGSGTGRLNVLNPLLDRA